MEIPNCGLVAGKVEFYSKEPDRPTAIEFYDMIMFMDQKRYIKRDKFGATANMFTFASVFAKVGLFNEKLKSGGDGEWGKRVFAYGYKQIYASDARVKHPARSSLSQLHKKVVRVAGGHYERDRGNMNLGQEILKRLRPPVKFLRWRLSDERLQGNKEKLMFVFVTIFVNYLTAWEMLRLQMGGRAKRS
ncbi:MAG: hypothetical protein EBE86_015795 [Hormoscilla sp. GUM202]|nr:hypothetical protein [Hormoscilla sp. GUM202]